MIRISISGPQLSGKGVISQKIIGHLLKEGKTYRLEQDGASVEANSSNPDVIITETNTLLEGE